MNNPMCWTIPIALFGFGGYLFLTHTSRELLVPVGKDFFTARLHRMSRPELAYRVSLNVGENNASQITSLVDTGSHRLWVDARKASSSLKVYEPDRFVVNYMGGSVRGDFGVETISIQNYSWKQTLGVAKESTMGMVEFQSILGLSRTCPDETCAHAYWPLKQQTFAFFVDPDTSEGVFQAGWFNQSECTDNFTFTLLISGTLANGATQEVFWTISVGIFNLSNLTAVVDTGTSYVLLKPNLFSIFMTKVAECNCQQSCMPDLTLKIGGRRFVIPSSTYIINTGLRSCKLRVERLDQRFPEDILLGASFLMYHYILFDADHNRFGICNPKESNGTDISQFVRGMWYDFEDNTRYLFDSIR